MAQGIAEGAEDDVEHRQICIVVAVLTTTMMLRVALRTLYEKAQPMRRTHVGVLELQRLLLFLNLLAEGVGGQTAVHPGCLAGAFIYELSQFDSEMRALLMQGVLHWRAMIVTRLKQIIPLYPPRTEVDVDVLGDMFTSAIEGGIMLARLFDSNQPISQQVLAFRTHIRLLFEPDLRG